VNILNDVPQISLGTSMIKSDISRPDPEDNISRPDPEDTQAIRQLMAAPEKQPKKIGFQLRDKRAVYSSRG
jgi:hypothetical protein